MRPPILSREAHEQHRQEERDDFEGVEPIGMSSESSLQEANARRRDIQQRQRLVDDPPDEDEDGDDEERDLDARTHRDGECKVDLVAVGDEDGGDVLRGVTDAVGNVSGPTQTNIDGDLHCKQDQTQPFCAYAPRSTDPLE